MLAERGTERQVEKRPNLTTSKNAERQKVLPPFASHCYSLPKWLRSPSGIENNRRFLRGQGLSLERATQNPTHPGLRRRPQRAGYRQLPAIERDRIKLDQESSGEFRMRTYTAVIERCPDTGLYVGYVPGLPGAHSQGETIEELNRNLAEVIEMLLQDGEPALESEFIGTQTVQVG
jgi:predicted RNase H-like HicB family nuclease